VRLRQYFRVDKTLLRTAGDRLKFRLENFSVKICNARLTVPRSKPVTLRTVPGCAVANAVIVGNVKSLLQLIAFIGLDQVL
jgi:hypothetical protein